MKPIHQWFTPRSVAVLTGALLPGCVWAWLIYRLQGAVPAPHGIPQAAGPAVTTPRPLSAASQKLLAATSFPEGAVNRGEQGELEMMRSLQSIPLEEMQAACEALLPLEIHSERTAPLRALLERWTALAPEAAFTWIISTAERAEEAKDEWRIVINACGCTWAAADGAAFVRWWRATGSHIPAGEVEADFGGFNVREHITVEMASWLAMGCPSEALAYFTSTPDIKRPDGSGRLVSFGRYSTGEFDAGTLVHTPDEIRSALQLLLGCRDTNEEWLPVAKQILRKWAALDGADMEQWIRAHPDSPLAESAREILALHRLRHSEDTAAAANAWLADRGDQTEEQLLSRIITEWSLTDLNAAGRWLDSLPRTPQRWRAIEQFAGRALAQDPDAAFTWLTTVEHPAQRRARIARVFDNWERLHPEQAAAFLREHPFDAAQMQWINERRAVR